MGPIDCDWPTLVLASAITFVTSTLVVLPLGAECNTAPQAEADEVAVLDTSIAFIDPLANDFDADGQPLSLQYLGDSCFGGVVVTDDTLTYSQHRPPQPHQFQRSEHRLDTGKR